MNSKNDEWKEKLSEDRYKVLREKATEAPFSGDLLYNDEAGTYVCGACGNPLFSSEQKFDSGSGWPSFYDVLSTDAVKLTEDRSLNMRRVEILCAKCDSHLGHVFHDAPDQPTGVRFCVNSLSLDFKPAEEQGSEQNK